MEFSTTNTAVAYQHSFDKDKAKAIAEQWNLPYLGDIAAARLQQQYPFVLVQTEHILQLEKLDEPKLGGISVDFVGGAVGHRRKFGGGRGQDIAKAIGLKHGFNPLVLDATAGLGRDAFVLANLGCQVQMMERNPAVAALLEDGISRGTQDPDIGGIVKQMSLIYVSSIEKMELAQQPDVIYLDPMYPHREKSAAVKKEMRVFQSLVGDDPDADQLLVPALALAKYRVVVKRPSYADFLDGKKPSTSIKMKKNRFDVYVNQAIPKN